MQEQIIQETEWHGFHSDTAEEQANYFAFCLLMPEKEFRRAANEYTSGNEIDVLKLANRFHVTIPVAISRLKDLEII